MVTVVRTDLLSIQLLARCWPCALLPGTHWVCVFPQGLCSRKMLSMWELLPASSRTAHPMRKIWGVCCGCDWAAQQRGRCLAALGVLAQQSPGGKQAVLGVLSSGFGKGSRTQGCSVYTKWRAQVYTCSKAAEAAPAPLLLGP